MSHCKTALTRRPRTGTSKVWESAKASLDTPPHRRTEADVENIIKFSKRLPFFKYVSTTAREALCRTMQHVMLQEGEVAIKGPKDIEFVWFIVVKGRCDMLLRTEETGKHYPMRAFEEGDTFAYSYIKMLTGDANAHQQGDIRAREPNTSLVRVYVEEEHRGDFRSQTKPLLYEELAMYFDMAADQAADRLGLCMSAIKKICRRHGIIRWPHRKLLSASKSLALIDSKMMEGDQTPQSQAILRNEAICVLVSKLRVMLNPTYLVNSELVQAQPAQGAGQEGGARVDDMFELEGSLSPISDAELSDSDMAPAPGAKRKKNAKAPNGSAKDSKDKKARGLGADHNGKAGQAHGRGDAALNGGGWPMAAKQEARDDKDPHVLAGLANGLPVGQVSVITAALPLGVSSAPTNGAHRAADAGTDGEAHKGDVSIEHLSNMVRASLEKVPANVREQVLSTVITGMHGGGGRGGGAGVSGATPRQLHQHPAHAHHSLPMLQRPQGLEHMFPGPYPYMQIPSMMQQGHTHGIFAPHQHLAANQSIQAGLAQVRRLPSPHHKLNGGPGDPAGGAGGGLLHHGQTLGHFADPAALANATRNDESSDDEAAAASAWTPAAHDQRQHDSVQMVSIEQKAGTRGHALIWRLCPGMARPRVKPMVTSAPFAQGGVRNAPNAPHHLSQPLDKLLQFPGVGVRGPQGQPSWMRIPVGSGEAHSDAAHPLTLTSPLATAMAGGGMVGGHLRGSDHMSLPMSSGPDSPRSVPAACTSARTTRVMLVPAPCLCCRSLAAARARGGAPARGLNKGLRG